MANPVLLIVDDNADLLKQLQRDLERRYGEQYRVITASSSHAALTTLQQLKKKNDRVALILMDQRLPDMPAGDQSGVRALMFMTNEELVPLLLSSATDDWFHDESVPLLLSSGLLVACSTNRFSDAGRGDIRSCRNHPKRKPRARLNPPARRRCSASAAATICAGGPARSARNAERIWTTSLEAIR